MLHKSRWLLLLTMALTQLANAQLKMNADAEFYNGPYDSLLAKGDKAYSSGKILGVSTPALAVMFYDRAIELTPEKADAYWKKGDALSSYRLLEDALETYNGCLEVDPTAPRCLYGVFYTGYLGSIKNKLNEVPKAQMQQIYNSAVAFLKVAPADMVQEKANAQVLGYMFKLGVDNNAAFQKYVANDVDDLTPENVQAFKELVPVVQATNNAPIMADIFDKLTNDAFLKYDYAKTKEYANQALATGYAYATTYFILAHTLYYDDKNSAEAIKVIDAGLNHDPGFDKLSNLKLQIYLDQGKTAFTAKDYVNAAAQFSKVVAKKPEMERPLAYLAFSTYASKKYPEALKNLKQLKKIADPLTVKIYYPNLDALIAFAAKPTATPPPFQTTLLEVEKWEKVDDEASILSDQKKFQEALDMLAPAVTYFEQTKDPVNISLIYTEVGKNYHNMENYEKAKECYRKSIDAGGFNTGAYSNLGTILYAVDNNNDEAEKIVKQGLEKYPESKQLNTRLGKIYAAKGDVAFDAKDYPTAISNYEKANEYYTDPEVYTFLGFSYYFNKESEKCLEALDNAVSMDKSLIDRYPAIAQIVEALK